MLHIIHGSDTFTARETVRQVLASVSSDSAPAETVNWIDGRTATQDEILQACEQVSMFGDTRRVVVEGLLSRFGRADSRNRVTRTKGRRKKTPDTGEWAQFAERVTALPDQSLLILLDVDPGRTNPLLEALTPAATVHRLDPPKGADLLRWIHNRVSLVNGHIERNAAERLAAHIGPDLWQLDSEIHKLVTYSDGAPITVSMVDAMLTAAVTPSIFMLVDAIVERNEKQARHRLDDMYQKGLSAGYVFTMVGRQLRLLALVREARDHHTSDRELPGELASLQPFALQRATQQAQRYSDHQVRRALVHVLEADRRIKTGMYDDHMALTMLITNLLPASNR